MRRQALGDFIAQVGYFLSYLFKHDIWRFFCHLDPANTFLALVHAAAFHDFLQWQTWIRAFGLRGIHQGESWQVLGRSLCVHNRVKKHVSRDISAEPGCSSSCSIRMQKRLLSPCRRGAVPWLRAHTEEEGLAAARGTWELTVLEKKEIKVYYFIVLLSFPISTASQNEEKLYFPLCEQSSEQLSITAGTTFFRGKAFTQSFVEPRWRHEVMSSFRCALVTWGGSFLALSFVCHTVFATSLHKPQLPSVQ